MRECVESLWTLKEFMCIINAGSNRGHQSGGNEAKFLFSELLVITSNNPFYHCISAPQTPTLGFNSSVFNLICSFSVWLVLFVSLFVFFL